MSRCEELNSRHREDPGSEFHLVGSQSVFSGLPLPQVFKDYLLTEHKSVSWTNLGRLSAALEGGEVFKACSAIASLKYVPETLFRSTFSFPIKFELGGNCVNAYCTLIRTQNTTEKQ